MRRWILGSALIVLAGIAVAAWYWRSDVVQVTQSVQQAITPEPTIRFAVVGDNHGVNPVYRQIIDDLKGEDFQFLLNLADTSEQGEIAEFQAVKELESTLPFPVYHTIGSHDIKADDTRRGFISVFGHDRWYSVDHGQMHLIILDNGDRKVGFPVEELDWLEDDLAAHADRVNIIAYHRPFGLPLAALLGDDETAASTKTNERLVQILAASKVKQIFSSHLHTYLPYTLAGVPAVVTGGGGDPAQIVLGGATNNYFHYLDVKIKGGDITITPVPVAIQATTAE